MMTNTRPLIAGMVRPGVMPGRGAPVNIRGAPFRQGVPRGGVLPPGRGPLNGVPARGTLQRPLVRYRGLFFSFSDPDSIRLVDPYPDSDSGSRSRRAKMTHKSRKI
jgi:hypothetical protein